MMDTVCVYCRSMQKTRIKNPVQNSQLEFRRGVDSQLLGDGFQSESYDLFVVRHFQRVSPDLQHVSVSGSFYKIFLPRLDASTRKNISQCFELCSFRALLPCGRAFHLEFGQLGSEPWFRSGEAVYLMPWSATISAIHFK